MIDYTEKDDNKLTSWQAAIATGMILIVVILMFFGFYKFYVDMEKAQNHSYVTPVKNSYQIKIGSRMLVKPLNVHKANHDWTQDVIEVKVLNITDGGDKYMKFVDSNGKYTWKRFSEITIVKVLEE